MPGGPTPPDAALDQPPPPGKAHSLRRKADEQYERDKTFQDVMLRRTQDRACDQRATRHRGGGGVRVDPFPPRPHEEAATEDHNSLAEASVP